MKLLDGLPHSMLTGIFIYSQQTGTKTQQKRKKRRKRREKKERVTIV